MGLDSRFVDLENVGLPATLKPSPALEAPGHDHLLGLAYDRKTWACPMSTVLATVAFLLLLDTSLLSQAGTSHYSQLLSRAVGAGPAGPAAAGPIFGQLTRAIMPYELRRVVQLLL